MNDNDNRCFADVNLPFHVWVREGNRWVLRATPQGDDAGDALARIEPPKRTDGKTAGENRRAA
jgi:hypothetical protein